MFYFWRYHRTHPMTFPSIPDQKILKTRKRSYATTPTCAAASLACCSSFFLCLSSCDKRNSSEWCLCSRSFYYNNVLREDWKAKDFSLAMTFALWWLHWQKIDFKFISLYKKKLKLHFSWIQEAPTSEKYVLTFQDYEQMETDFLLIRRQKLAIFVLPNNQNFELVLKYLNVL